MYTGMYFRDISVFSSQETCESGCVLPHGLSIQMLWARQGLLSLPQSYILGARYLFQCQSFKVCFLILRINFLNCCSFYRFTSENPPFAVIVFCFFSSVLCGPLSLWPPQSHSLTVQSTQNPPGACLSLTGSFRLASSQEAPLSWMATSLSTAAAAAHRRSRGV